MGKRVFLIGGYQKAQALSASLIKKGFQITIINDNYASCTELAEIDGVIVIHGDGTRPYILEDAGITDADIAIALTRRDDENLVICELCKKKFRVKRTVSLVNDPKKIDFFYRMGVDSVVCAISTITSVIEQQAFMDDITSIMPIGEGRINIAQIPISSSAPATGKKLWELTLPEAVIIGCILRGETTIIPRGDTRIQDGDVLVLISSNNQELSAIQELTGR